jgi:hypothetical protein
MISRATLLTLSTLKALTLRSSGTDHPGSRDMVDENGDPVLVEVGPSDPRGRGRKEA